jgi:DNA replication protein DnaC
MTNNFIQKANQLRMYSISKKWETIEKIPELLKHVKQILTWEEDERLRRKLELLVKKNGIKTVEHIATFDWQWPKKINREQIEDFFSLKFLSENVNIILIGPNGVGKSMIAKNLVQTASEQGFSAMFTESSVLLDDLIKQATISGLERALQRYVKPKLLAIDEIGYLSYDSRHADLLFQLINRRTQNSSTIITTNKVFSEWPSVFPNAACVTALIDRLIERCEVCKIEGASFRGKRFQERETERKKNRKIKSDLKKNTINDDQIDSF